MSLALSEYILLLFHPQTPHASSEAVIGIKTPDLRANMFSKFAAIALSVTILAAATPTPQTSSIQCTLESIRCCKEIEDSSSPSITALYPSLGITPILPGVPVGVSCAPIDLTAVASTREWYVERKVLYQ